MAAAPGVTSPSWAPRIALGCTLALGLAGCSGPPPELPPDLLPPDLLLVSLDTLRGDRAGTSLGRNGERRVTMPLLEQWAREGQRFERAYSTAPQTAASHMSLFSGLAPLVHGVSNARPDSKTVSALHPEWPTLAEVLGAAGYATVGFANGGQLYGEMGFDRGFDLFLSSLNETPAQLQNVENALELMSPEQPLFLFFHTYLPHAPYLPLPARFEAFTDQGYQGPFRQRYEGLLGLDLAKAHRLSGQFLELDREPNQRDLRFLSDLYDANLARADSALSRLARVMENSGRARKQLWCVTSDHGEAFGEHGELGHKRRLDGELLRVPLVLRSVGFELQLESELLEEPFGLDCLAAKLTGLLGVEPASQWSRASGTGALSQIGFVRDWQQALTLGQRRYFVAGGREGRRRWVIDLQADPLEQNPLEPTEADQSGFDYLDQVMLQSARDTQDRRPVRRAIELNARTQAELEALGYAED